MLTGCPECGDRKVIISCHERGGWVIKCNHYQHELFPFPGMTVVAYDVEITPSKITYRTK